MARDASRVAHSVCRSTDFHSAVPAGTLALRLTELLTIARCRSPVARRLFGCRSAAFAPALHFPRLATGCRTEAPQAALGNIIIPGHNKRQSNDCLLSCRVVSCYLFSFSAAAACAFASAACNCSMLNACASVSVEAFEIVSFSRFWALAFLEISAFAILSSLTAA